MLEDTAPTKPSPFPHPRLPGIIAKSVPQVSGPPPYNVQALAMAFSTKEDPSPKKLIFIKGLTTRPSHERELQATHLRVTDFPLHLPPLAPEIAKVSILSYLM